MCKKNNKLMHKSATGFFNELRGIFRACRRIKYFIDRFSFPNLPLHICIDCFKMKSEMIIRFVGIIL